MIIIDKSDNYEDNYMKSLVGYTGFVGSNIAEKASFDGLYNSKNITEAFDTKPDLLIYSGVRAEKYLANKEPEKDYEIISEAINNIKKINPKRLVLISTIDVYKNPVNVNEDKIIETTELHPYGLNRYLLEKWVEESLDKYLIIRLPGLYGKNIKKNFIFDIMSFIPMMLTTDKFNELSQIDKSVSEYYIRLDNGFYKCRQLTLAESDILKLYFKRVKFSALNFTDSRSSFQFYNLSYLWSHINTALENNISKLNIATEPVTAAEIYKYIFKTDFVNEISHFPAKYDYRSRFMNVYKGKDGYIFDKEFILNDIKKFVGDYSL